MTESESTAPAPRRHRVRAVVLTGVAGALLAGGGVAYAAADSAPSAPNPPAAPGARPTAPAPRPHLDGTVTTVAGDRIVVTDHDGFERTINTSSSTRYAGGLSAPVRTGTRIHAEGTVADDRTSLDATLVTTMPTPPTPPKGGPAGAPKGGPAGAPKGGPAGAPKGTGKGAPTPPKGTPPKGTPAKGTQAPTPPTPSGSSS